MCKSLFSFVLLCFVLFWFFFWNACKGSFWSRNMSNEMGKKWKQKNYFKRTNTAQDEKKPHVQINKIKIKIKQNQTKQKIRWYTLDWTAYSTTLGNTLSSMLANWLAVYWWFRLKWMKIILSFSCSLIHSFWMLSVRLAERIGDDCRTYSDYAPFKVTLGIVRNG